MRPDENIIDEINTYWSDHRHCTQIRRYLGTGSPALSWIEMQLRAYPWFETEYNVLSFAVKGIFEPARCLNCGRILDLVNAREGKRYCSLKCSSSSKETKEKVASTLMERYGSRSLMGSEALRKRQHASMKKKYGSEYTMTSESLNAKRKRTILERYGVDHYAKTDEFKEKIKTTCLERYGVDHYAKTDDFREKSSESNRKKGYALLERWKDYVVPLFTEEEYEGMQGLHHNKIYKWKCVKCGTEFEFRSHPTGVHTELGTCFPVCPNCCKRLGSSFEENELLDFIESIYDGKIVEHSRDVVNPYELDIYIPDKKLAIEFDGLYWHSEEKGKGRMYHSHKTDKCLENGIRLIHIFEDEWICNKEIVKDRIRSMLGAEQKRIFARKCDLKEIDAKASNDFLDENHLQGADHSSIRYGLYYNGELVSVMTFSKPRFNKNYDWELVRFASKVGCFVTGGASRLLTHFRRNHSGTIISYADRRYSDGHLYDSIGFSKVQVSSPNYWWFKSDRKKSRYECQKHHLKDLLGERFDPSLSETENMMRNGYHKIYDCGNIVYEYGDVK